MWPTARHAMRLSERNFEYNFVSALARHFAPWKLRWFAPSQPLEQHLGWDAVLNLGGTHLFIQCKAPDYDNNPDCGNPDHHIRTYGLSHTQLLQLRELAGGVAGFVYLVVPTLRTWHEWAASGWDVTGHVRRYDMSQLPAAVVAPPPGPHRLYADWQCGQVELLSEPISLTFEAGLDGFGPPRDLAAGFRERFTSESAFEDALAKMPRSARVATLLPPG